MTYGKIDPRKVEQADRERHGHLRLSLRSSEQLFNSFDPAPFHERDLDDDAERYLVDWAGDLDPRAELRLTLDLRQPPADPDPARSIAEAIHHHFGERARLEQAALVRLLRQGRFSLAIGLGFLTVCTLVAQSFARVPDDTLTQLLREGFLITGWVAMWRPIQTYLYDWWPLRRRRRLYQRLARMPVELRIATGADDRGPAG